MHQHTLSTLGSGAKVKIFPSAIVVFNFSDGDDGDGRLAQIVSSHPGEAVIFLNTRYSKSVFSQAENRNRSFIFLRDSINPADVDPEYPVQWISGGDFIPMVPGNLTIEATDGGFRVNSIAPDPERTAFFA